jgi:hypothetical protein
MLWEGNFILPEHKQAILERKRQQQKVKKPILDEQKLQQLNETICEAMAESKILLIKYYHDGKIHILTGKVGYYDETYRQLRIISINGELQILEIESIIDAEIKG